MSNEPRLFRIDPVSKSSETVTEVDFADLGFQERRDIQEWIVANPHILGEDILVIAKEFSGFDRTRERADVVCIDSEGNLVVVELKRDDSGSNVHWQAIKYASYFHQATPDQIVSMLSKHEAISEEESVQRLLDHTESDDLQHLNADQRVILVSHRFAPEVTSAVLWLNNKAASDYFITCIQLTPFKDSATNSLYIQASTIIPVPGTEDMRIGTNPFEGTRAPIRGNSNKLDEVSQFFRTVSSNAEMELPIELRPARRSRWTGGGGDFRYFNLWYTTPPWKLRRMQYRLIRSRKDEQSPYTVTVRFTCDKINQIKAHTANEDWLSESELQALKTNLAALEISGSEGVYETDNGRLMRIDINFNNEGLDEEFGESVSKSLTDLINAVTPVINEIVEAKNEI